VRWLGLHLEVEVITRDRSSLYADGGRQGASSAVQIRDRYHLVSNLSEATFSKCCSTRFTDLVDPVQRGLGWSGHDVRWNVFCLN
jgi:hypothetical protein